MTTREDEMEFDHGYNWERLNLEGISEISSADSIPLKKKEGKLENAEVLFTWKHLTDPIDFWVH